MTTLDIELAMACISSNCHYTGIVSTENHKASFLKKITDEVYAGFFDAQMSELYDPTAVAALAVAEQNANAQDSNDDLEPAAKKQRTGNDKKNKQAKKTAPTQKKDKKDTTDKKDTQVKKDTKDKTKQKGDDSIGAALEKILNGEEAEILDDDQDDEDGDEDEGVGASA